MTQVTKKTQQRITRAVQWVERQVVPQKLGRAMDLSRGFPLSVLAIADEDIETQTVGKATLASGNTTSGFTRAIGVEQYDVYNPGDIIKKDDQILISWAMWEPDEFEGTWVASPTGTGVGDEMWCGITCFWVDECCVYRGVVKRMTQTEDFCNIIMADSLPAWIVHDPVVDEGLEPGEPGFEMPIPYLPNYTQGWVRKLADEMECTYILPGTQDVEITEILPVFEYCRIELRSCPLTKQKVHVRILSTTCDTINGIELDLTWVPKEDIQHPPMNLLDCSYDGEPDIYDRGAWIGEFTVPTTANVRLFDATYWIPGDPPELEIGWVRLHWCTGELITLYNDDGSGVPKVETREYSGITLTGGCTILLDALENPVRESVEYSYRILFSCLIDAMGAKNLCLEHIHPPCHPFAGEALQDAGRGTNFYEICVNSFLAEVYGDWGQSPTWSYPSVGYFYGPSGPNQFANHRFGGCDNDLGLYCEFLETSKLFRIWLTW